MKTNSRRGTGNRGEEMAVRYLEKLGYSILERNYIFQHGEIDIIAREGNELVFVEVKLRRSSTFGTPEESITERKQKLLRRTAEGYLAVNNIVDVPCRFDVVAIQIDGGRTVYRLYKNAIL
jgi:putative endonuclease